MAGRKRRSPSGLSIGNCKVEVEGSELVFESKRDELLISVGESSKIRISVNNSRKYNTRKTCKDEILTTAKSEVGDGVLSSEYGLFFLLNPKDVGCYSESLLKEALSIYTTELPTMNYAANTGKESQFLERCLSSGKYRTLILKSNCIKGPREVIAAISYQIVPADTQYAEIPLAAVCSNYQKKGVGQLIYKELRRRLQSVGVSTIFCWADKESEGFWSKQGFISIGEVNTKGRIRKLPIKADVRRALSFPGGSILMVANLTDDAKVSVNSFEHATMNLPLKADSPQIEEGRECQHVMNSNLLNENGVPNSVNGDVRNSQHQLSTNDISAPNKQQHEGSSPSGPKLQGVVGFFPCSRTGYINLETFPEVSNDKHGPIGGKCCSCSGNNTEDRVWEATLSSLKSKRVKGVKSSNPKLDYEIDSRNDMSMVPSCTYPSSSLVKVVPDDPQQGSVLTSPLEGNDPTHNTAEDQSNDDLTLRKECPRIMFMNIADESKKTCLAKIVDQLGGVVTSHGNMSTHVITGKARRTLNFCTALCSGAWIVSPNWLKTSFREGKFVDESNFILEDEDFVLKYKSKLRNSVLRAKGNPCSLLKGYNVCLAKHIQPTVDILSSIVKSAGGTVIRRLDNIKEPSKTIFLACEEDTEEAVVAAKRGIWTYGSDWFMNCVMKQELDFVAPQFVESL